jgi:hypothetical protein
LARRGISSSRAVTIRRHGAAISTTGQPHRFIWSGTAPGLGQPERYYTSPEVFAEEVRRIPIASTGSSYWFFVGCADEMRGAGAWRAIATVGGPELVASDAEPVLRLRPFLPPSSLDPGVELRRGGTAGLPVWPA